MMADRLEAVARIKTDADMLRDLAYHRRLADILEAELMHSFEQRGVDTETSERYVLVCKKLADALS